MNDLKKPTVTVAVVALNEEQNIVQFLQSVLAQHERGFELQKVLVISDGSTDRTMEVVKSIGDPRIEVRAYQERIGKSARLNEIYQVLDTDYLVQSDADCVFSTEHLIANMLQPMVENAAVLMCGGNLIPVPEKTFVERCVNASAVAYRRLREVWNGGDNQLSANGGILAYRASFISTVTIPDDMIANDRFTYFSCKAKGGEYRFVPSAVVWFRSPQTLADHIRQNTRFEAVPTRMRKHFSEELVLQEYRMPIWLLRRFMVEQFLCHPIRCTTLALMNVYCRVRAWRMERARRLTAVWEMAPTTKNLI